MRIADGLGGVAPRASRVERATGGALDMFSRVSAPAAWGAVVVGLAVSWLVAYLVGGAGVAAPHWFYLPVLYAAARFGCLGAAVSAVAAGVLAGPLMPLDVAAGIAQQPEDWITRASFFVIIGQAMALVIGLSRSAMAAEFERQQREKELGSGIHRGEFLLHYQPIVSLSSGEIVGAEALVRWQHPVWGLVFPDRIIAPAETSGLIVELGEQVLDMACRQVLAWRSGPLGKHESFKLAVNVSGRQLAEPGLVAQVDERIRALGIEPSWLHLEVTETALVADVEASTARLGELKALGVALAIDDFGTGRASLCDTALAPKGVPHTYRVQSQRARWLTVTAHGDFEALVRSFSPAAARSELPPSSGPPTPEQAEALAAACLEHGIELVGPPLR